MSLLRLAVVGALLFAGCAGGSGRPTLTIDAELAITFYMTERDEFLDQTYQARHRCARLDPDKASSIQKGKCSELAAKRLVWAGYDRVVLTALLTRSTLDPETVRAATAAGKDLLGLALEIAPLFGAL